MVPFAIMVNHTALLLLTPSAAAIKPLLLQWMVPLSPADIGISSYYYKKGLY
jgi:hypothetical protein